MKISVAVAVLVVLLTVLPQNSLAFIPPSTQQISKKVPSGVLDLSYADRGFLWNTRRGGRCTDRDRLVVVVGVPGVSRSTRLHGVFGLGFGEIVIIGVAVGFLLGPETIGKWFRSSVESAAQVAREVPEEFQKGLEEGESEARSRTAKVIRVKKVVPGTDEQDAELEN